ncbi:hypothetical protein BDFG_00131 [Blastomyces dermatitidis ATCC 26199]|nr:hypothetical protein BDFG_00131 [Blastomyces dermatitidis ATCC 26199]
MSKSYQKMQPMVSTAGTELAAIATTSFTVSTTYITCQRINRTRRNTLATTRKQQSENCIPPRALNAEDVGVGTNAANAIQNSRIEISRTSSRMSVGPVHDIQAVPVPRPQGVSPPIDIDTEAEPPYSFLANRETRPTW